MKVKIFHKDYKINYCSKLASDRGRFGECSYLNGAIDISSEITKSTQASVLLHEIMHASLECVRPELNNEENATAFELIFATVIKDNKELFKKIIKDI